MEIRAKFHNKLKGLQDEILVMGSMVEKALLYSVEALKNRDLALAREIVIGDLKINAKRFEIEEQCVELIATQQPMASDLRTLVSMTSITTELERIADHAEGIAKIAIMNGDEPPVKPLVILPRMAEQTAQMLQNSLKALINRDPASARQIAVEDDQIDTYYSQVFRELIVIMTEDPRAITRATRLIWVAHNLERSADRVTNICERVVFIATGKIEEIQASKY
ncbi:MAG: phosphate signaling complex protein PhoU [Dehalococcoidaceae bacterium]|nr:phosphate signaling complex protein PhoU [Dehalococcoidaceae bacterium]